MRKITLFLMSLLLTVGAMAQDYSTNYDGQSKNRRPINYVALTSPALGEFKVELTSAENNSLVVNKTDIVFKCNVGETVTPSTGYTAGWMHTYVYIDADNNGFIAEATNAADLVSFAYYNGRNSLGNTVGDNIVAAPSFTAPTTPGTYRMRFKIDWNNIDPKGSVDANNTMSANAGGIIDVTLQVVELPVYTVTYNYKQNGVLVGSISHQAAQGSEFPALVSGLYNVTVNSSKPEGTVQEDGEYNIDVTIGEMPFEYYTSVDAIPANGWYNLVMHSNWNTGAGSGKYRTYVGGNNGETLEWGTQRSLTNPSDDYFWAFVGDPINGFNVVNKGAGEGQILSSNGTANPLLKDAADLPEGYNTTWSINARKYDVTTEGDYILEGAWFCLKHTNGKYINANAGNGNVAFWTDNDNGSAILAVKPLEINEAADIATYYSDNYVTIPSTMGAEIRYVNSIENGYAKTNLIEGEVIPAQTGVIVKYNVESSVVYAPEITSKGTTTGIEDNMLKGTVKRTLIEKNGKTCYALWLKDGVPGFYNAAIGEGEDADVTQFYNSAYKAYLEIEGASEVQFYGMRFDEETTAIENVETATVNVIYDLSGRRVNEITEKGIYVVNGKKVLVK